MNRALVAMASRVAHAPRGVGVRQLMRQSKDQAATAHAAAGLELNWDEFFRLRKQRRLWERLASLPCAMLGLGAGSAVFASLPVNPQQTFMGIDPLMLFGGSALFCGVLGFVIGPTVGRVWYRIGSKDVARMLEKKEVEFFTHIRANRSDPSFSSASNPLPDFYGEKINSLSAYRKWLRKQREHERKGTFNLGSKRK
ncbi:TIM23 complex component [Coemansia biformis]|uniref:Presequence translocated-associated motor subunit PAM17 n=1 Tax=Coemansia biformis TaxID=1286918 RepID=A0A9W7YCP2_9FUNG|nr:TIM23 complex component [Coemansia biformis]